MSERTPITADYLSSLVKKNQKEGIVSVDYGDDKIIRIKTYLTMEEMMVFVNSVCDFCIEDESGTYNPHFKDYAIGKCMVNLYSDVELPLNPMEAYEVIYGTDILGRIRAHINLDQLDDILRSIEEKLAIQTQAHIDMIKQKAEEVQKNADKLNSDMQAFFDNINMDDLNNLFAALGQTGLDEDKLVKAYINNTKKSKTKKPDGMSKKYNKEVSSDNIKETSTVHLLKTEESVILEEE